MGIPVSVEAEGPEPRVILPETVPASAFTSSSIASGMVLVIATAAARKSPLLPLLVWL
jgi:hypothetical protein